MAAYWAGKAVAQATTLRKMKKAGATSEKSAKKPEELRVHKSYLDELVKLGRLKRTEDDRYYLPCEGEKLSSC